MSSAEDSVYDPNEEGEEENESDDTSSMSSQSNDYEAVITRVQEIEHLVMMDYARNEQAIPDIQKKGSSQLSIDKAAEVLFKDPQNSSSFAVYISQRRENRQSQETVMIHAAQFISFAKQEKHTLRSQSPLDILAYIANSIPTLCHLHFDYLHRMKLQPATILARIDSLILLFEWMRINSNDVSLYRDV